MVERQGFDGLSDELLVSVDRKRSLSWNIEKAFSKAKDIERKVSGSQQRLELLRQVLEAVQNCEIPLKLFRSQQKKKSSSNTIIDISVTIRPLSSEK